MQKWAGCVVDVDSGVDLRSASEGSAGAGVTSGLGVWLLLKQHAALSWQPRLQPSPVRCPHHAFPRSLSLLDIHSLRRHRIRSCQSTHLVARATVFTHPLLGGSGQYTGSSHRFAPQTTPHARHRPPPWASATSRRYAQRPRFHCARWWATRTSTAARAYKQSATRAPLRSPTRSSSRPPTTSCTFWL